MLICQHEDGVYKGRFDGGKMNGICEYETNSEHFFGEFSDGKRNGVGFCRMTKGNVATLSCYKDDVVADIRIEFEKSQVTIKHYEEERISGFIQYGNGDLYIGGLIEVPSEGYDSGKEVKET